MKNQFCTYEISLALKEIGFDEPCLMFFDKEKELNYCPHWFSNSTLIPNEDISAPLWQQVIDFFREKHNIWISINVEILTLNHSWEIFRPLNDELEIITYKDNSDEWDLSYHKARECAIVKAIEIIKKIKNESI